MRISVVGCGYLGAVHAACMAQLGHEVVGYDTDAAKIEGLSKGSPTFFEPGLPELLAQTLTTGRLTFTSDPAAMTGSEVVFICVGTPQRRGELAADTSYVYAATRTVAEHVGGDVLVVGKSTVPVGTAAKLAGLLAERRPDAELAWNPEFLREGFAVNDTLHPDRLVFGVAGERAESVLREVYAIPIAEGSPVVVTGFETAELVKTAANAFLATKISFINAMAEVCEAVGGDVAQLADAIGHDERIGRKFLGAGLGFGGGCLPKDIRAFMARAGELGADQALTFLREVDAINLRRRAHVVELARAELDTFVGPRVAVLGAAFKPESDDIRDSPALNVASQIHLQGADVVVADPAALENARRSWPTLGYAETAEEAMAGADLTILATEWRQFRELDPEAVGKIVRNRRIIDARNVLDVDRWRAAGWRYRGLGRMTESRAG